MNTSCDGDTGATQQAPLPIFNRPGRDALSYRVGTHNSFLEAVLARLTQISLDNNSYPLKRLTTRDSSDPTIALLDAWAVVVDVLTFYQERIANEGYLRTSTERRSLLELGQLIGYMLRPGAAASVYLAYTLDTDQSTMLLAGNQAQSLPGPGELPQTFETSEKLDARAAWNVLTPLLTRAQFLVLHAQSNGDLVLADTSTVYFQGTATRLKPGDMLLFLSNNPLPTSYGAIHHAATVELQTAQNRTKVMVQSVSAPTNTSNQSNSTIDLVSSFKSLAHLPSSQPLSSQRVGSSLEQIFTSQSAIHTQLLKTFNPALANTLDVALSHANVAPDPPAGTQSAGSVQAFRIKAALFGNSVPSQLFPTQPVTLQSLQAPIAALVNKAHLLPLDTSYDQIVAGSWIVIEGMTSSAPALQTIRIIRQVVGVQTVTLSPADVLTKWQGDSAALSLLSSATKITLLTLNAPWLDQFASDGSVDLLSLLRGTTIHAQSEELPLTDIPLVDETSTYQPSLANTVQGKVIELDRLYPDLQPGRWLIISGERVDVSGVSGVVSSELALLAGVTQELHKVTGSGNEPDEQDDPNTLIALPGSKLHTFLHLVQPLTYAYKRDTVTIYGNVVHATHGETYSEVLGSGDGSTTLQQFSLRQSPLTYVSAPTQTGVESSLEIQVNNLRWHETDSLVHLQPGDRSYTTQTDDAGQTRVIFGDGGHGARLPTGVENIKAMYRTGIGTQGNVHARQISLLITRPLGVNSVTNPLPATGGVDREQRDQARLNIPSGVMAEGRLISLSDYAQFVQTFAGIDKASIVTLSDGYRQYIHISIASIGNIPLDPSSDLYRNLFLALQKFGDPQVPAQLAVCETLLLVIEATIHLQPDVVWETVEVAIRSALVEAFSFERRQLGQTVFQSEIIGVIQTIQGVDYIDLRRLDALDQEKTLQALQNTLPVNGLQKNAQSSGSLIAPQPQNIEAYLARSDPAHPHTILPAQLIFLSPDQPDTLILNLFGGA